MERYSNAINILGVAVQGRPLGWPTLSKAKSGQLLLKSSKSQHPLHHSRTWKVLWIAYLFLYKEVGCRHSGGFRAWRCSWLCLGGSSHEGNQGCYRRH
eukprot:507920-Pelagomonas_calceolata.AAC.1